MKDASGCKPTHLHDTYSANPFALNIAIHKNQQIAWIVDPVTKTKSFHFLKRFFYLK